MSEENEQGEEKPKDDLAGSDEFEFYFSFTKPLVLDLPSSEDRAIAAAWVQKLESEPESEEEKQLRLNYLKLLLFVLQRGRLSGIFRKQPPSGPLQPFPQGFSLIDMGNWMLDQDDGQPCGGGDARSVPYTIEISNDLREFVASQEIPNFGIQMYYAWSSDDPIHKWASFDEEKFPQFILDKIKQLKEIKSDEKSFITKNGCLTKKKGCDLNLQDKYSKKKVKSPQEIERSQGRSFHTYMGLVGRMGNFNDKCDDDPEKFQRQDQRKVKCQRRTPQKRCPTNGGEAEDMMPEEEYDNLVSGLGGLSTQARNCHCPYPCQHENCPDHHPKGGPQAFDCQPPPGRNGYGLRGDVEAVHCPPGGSKPPSPRRLMEEQCAELQMPQMRGPSGRSRSGSPARPNAECPPDDKGGGFPKQTGVCICSRPPCTCPCPRGTPPKATSNANSAVAGGRPLPDTNRCPPPETSRCPPPETSRCPPPEPIRCPPPETSRCPPPEPIRCPPPETSRCPPPESVRCPPPETSRCPPPESIRCPPKPAKQDLCGPEGYGNRVAPTYNVSTKTPDNCPPMGSPNAGNRTAGASMRAGQTEVVHCYDGRNPDPSLYEKMDKGWMDVARERGNKRLDADYQNFMTREQPSTGGQSAPNSRRGLFNPLAQSTPIAQEPCGVPSDIPRHAGRYCPPAGRVTSPPVHGHGQPCDYPAEDSNQSYNQTMNFSNQQYQPGFAECDGEAPSSIRSPEPYAQRPKTDPCRKSPPQAMSKPKTYAGAPSGNENGRMANMASVLQGMKQRTEAHREKCDPAATRRSPPNDAAYYSGNAQAAPQPKNRSQMAFDNGAMLAANCGPPRNARSGQQMFYSPQPKPTQQYSPYQERGYVSLPNSSQMKQCLPQQQPPPQRQPARPPTAAPINPECYPNNQPGFQEFEYEEEDCDADSGEYDSLEACRPESPIASPPQNMPRNMPPNCIPQGGPRGNAPMQDFSKNLMPMMYGGELDPQKDNCGPQWASMNSTDMESNKTSSSRGYQGEMVDMRSQKCPPQSSSPGRGSPTRNSPPRSSPVRASPPRNGSPRSSPPRSSPGRAPAQDMAASQRDCTPALTDGSRRAWPNRTSASGGRSPDMGNINWATPPGVPTEYLRGPSPDPRCQEVQPPPCPPPAAASMPCPPPSMPCPPPSMPCPPPSMPCPPPSMPCPPPSMPCPPPSNPCPPPNTPCPPQQRSPGSFSNYPPQAMNAELPYQDELCDDEMADDMANMDMNDMEGCDQQTYILQDEMCEDDMAAADFNAYGEEDNQNCDPQNFMAMRSSLDRGEECYDDYQDMNVDNCEPMPPPQNMPMNRSGGGQRNGSGQGQRICNPPPTNNRNPNCPDQFSGGMSTMHRH